VSVELQGLAFSGAGVQASRLCAAPFRAKLLICTGCPVPHDVGLVFARSDLPEIPPWCLFMSAEMGSA
jgi:hypothetical protein